MLAFWMEHRRRVVVLLDRAEGSAYAGFGDRFVDEVSRMTIAELRDVPDVRITQLIRFTLANIFQNSVRAIVGILESHDDEAQIRAAFAAFWSHQLAGLVGVEEWVRHGRGA